MNDAREITRDMLKEFFRFLGWLDEHPSFKWTMPKGVEKISRSPNKFPEDVGNPVRGPENAVSSRHADAQAVSPGHIMGIGP